MYFLFISIHLREDEHGLDDGEYHVDNGGDGENIAQLIPLFVVVVPAHEEDRGDCGQEEYQPEQTEYRRGKGGRGDYLGEGEDYQSDKNGNEKGENANADVCVLSVFVYTLAAVLTRSRC